MRFMLILSCQQIRTARNGSMALDGNDDG